MICICPKCNYKNECEEEFCVICGSPLKPLNCSSGGCSTGPPKEITVDQIVFVIRRLGSEKKVGALVRLREEVQLALRRAQKGEGEQLRLWEENG